MKKEELFELKIEEPDKKIYERIQNNWDGIAKPVDGLGDFEKIICKAGSILGTERVSFDKKALIIMCADNGVVMEGVSQTDKSVTRLVTELMGQNKSSVGIMAKELNLGIKVVDIGIDSDEIIDGVFNKNILKGTGDILVDNAMTEEECLKAITTGIEMVHMCKEEGYSIIATGEMGIGNTTTSTALLCALTGESAKKLTGRGAGLSDEGLMLKQAVIEGALRFHDIYGSMKNKNEVLSSLYKVGGLDIAGLTGVFIGGAIYHIPVIIDGLISSVAALCGEMLVPGVKDYCIPSHSGKESGVQLVLDRLGLKALINGNMALGEGTGAIMLFPLLDMVLSLYNSGTSFKDTTIEQYERFVN